jgi:7-cyano-7-deazaguanine synthase
MNTKDPSVVLVSGGIGSLVAAERAMTYSDAHWLYVDHGHAAAAAELRAVQRQADALACSLHVAKIPGPDALMDVYKRNASARETPQTQAMLPHRAVAGLQLTIVGLGQQLAESIGAKTIVSGVLRRGCSENATNSDLIDPQSCEVFQHALGCAMRLGRREKQRVEFELPFIAMGLADVLQVGLRAGAPLHLTWSCQFSDREPCGACEGCQSRREVFSQIGMPDATEQPARV